MTLLKVKYRNDSSSRKKKSHIITYSMCNHLLLCVITIYYCISLLVEIESLHGGSQTTMHNDYSFFSQQQIKLMRITQY